MTPRSPLHRCHYQPRRLTGASRRHTSLVWIENWALPELRLLAPIFHRGRRRSGHVLSSSHITVTRSSLTQNAKIDDIAQGFCNADCEKDTDGTCRAIFHSDHGLQLASISELNANPEAQRLPQVLANIRQADGSLNRAKNIPKRNKAAACSQPCNLSILNKHINHVSSYADGRDVVLQVPHGQGSRKRWAEKMSSCACCTISDHQTSKTGAWGRS